MYTNLKNDIEKLKIDTFTDIVSKRDAIKSVENCG